MESRITETNQLKARMVLFGFTIKSLAEDIGTGEQNLSMKINGKRKFNQVEIARIMKALRLSPEEVISMFLVEGGKQIVG